uniref:G-protein coupled receptors family 1 profile domain-containing protein n=1 Tax=Myotis lucifugus TaxID=59463 RepID=G1QEJ1_MYOLU
QDSAEGQESCNTLGMETGYTAPEIFTLVMYGITCVLGIVGNALVIWVAGFRMARTVTTLCYLNLALADFFFSAILPFFMVVNAMRGRWPYGCFLCKLFNIMGDTNLFASVFLIAFIALDRCICVLHPVWAQNNRTLSLAKKVIIVPWILALLLNLPVLIFFTTLTDENGDIYCDFNIDFWGDIGKEEKLQRYFTSEAIIGIIRKVRHHSSPGTSAYTQGQWSMKTVLQYLVGVSLHPDVLAKDKLKIQIQNKYRDIAVNESIKQYPIEDSQTRSLHSNYSRSSSTINSNHTLRLTTYSPMQYSIKSLVSFAHWADTPQKLLKVAITMLTARGVIRFVIGFTMPMSIVAICYGLIAVKLAKKGMLNSNRSLRVLTAVVASFFVCWFPFQLVALLHTVWLREIFFGSEYKVLGILGNPVSSLAYFNSCLNPMLYVFIGQDFRKTLIHSLPANLERALTED